MVIDFGDVSNYWKTFIEPRVDHVCLNDFLFTDEETPPTAENLAEWLHLMFSDFVSLMDVRVVNVRVWETPTGYADYYNEVVDE